MELLDKVRAIFENNVINWMVLVAALTWLGAKYVPGMLSARKEAIGLALNEAAKAKEEGQAFFAEQHQRMANAEKEAENILVEARQLAEQLKAQIEEKAKKEVADLRVRIEQDIKNERQLAITELRVAAAKAAIQLTHHALPASLTEGTKIKLINQFVDELEAAKN